jgi:hypothetical protein
VRPSEPTYPFPPLAIPATPATPAIPATPATLATPATPATVGAPVGSRLQASDRAQNRDRDRDKDRDRHPFSKPAAAPAAAPAAGRVTAPTPAELQAYAAKLKAVATLLKTELDSIKLPHQGILQTSTSFLSMKDNQTLTQSKALQRAASAAAKEARLAQNVANKAAVNAEIENEAPNLKKYLLAIEKEIISRIPTFVSYRTNPDIFTQHLMLFSRSILLEFKKIISDAMLVISKNPSHPENIKLQGQLQSTLSNLYTTLGLNLTHS